MKTSVFTILLFAAMAVSTAFGQNSMKLFDATSITPTDPTMPWNPRTPIVFASKDVYLSCPMGGTPYAYVTGPNNGNLIVDNFFTLNGENICPDEWSCFAGAFVSPDAALGMPMDSAYFGVPPIDIGPRLTSSGVYSFVLSDYSFYYGNSEIYLHTSCTFGTYVCHRNSGTAAPKTLPAVPPIPTGNTHPVPLPTRPIALRATS